MLERLPRPAKRGGTDSLSHSCLDGSTIVAGVLDAGDPFVARLDAGRPVWAVRLGDLGGSVILDRVTIDGLGRIIVAGSSDGAIVVLALDAGGHHLWARRFRGVGADDAIAVATGADDAVLVWGYYSESIELRSLSRVAA